MVLEQEHSPGAEDESRQLHPLALSAQTHERLDIFRLALRTYLLEHPDLRIGDVAYVLATRPRHGGHRLVLTAATLAAAVQKLGNKHAEVKLVDDEDLPVIFAFPGQGSQFVGAGQGLYETDEVFHDTLDECSNLLSETVGLDVRAVLMPRDGGEAEASGLLRQALWAQPAIFALEYALGRTLIAAGVRPALLIGHSVGEYAAACLAGVFSLPDALHMVAARGQLMWESAPGAMMAVNLTEDQLRARLPDDLDIAAINAPNQAVVSGPVTAVVRFARQLEKASVLHTVLGTSLAAHSAMMATAARSFRVVAKEVDFSAPVLPIVSTLTGEWVEPGTMTEPEYWVRHMRAPVLFLKGTRTALSRGRAVVVEVGAGRALAGMFRQSDAGADVRTVTPWVREVSELCSMAEIAACVWAAGGRIDWKKYFLEVSEEKRVLPGFTVEY